MLGGHPAAPRMLRGLQEGTHGSEPWEGGSPARPRLWPHCRDHVGMTGHACLQCCRCQSGCQRLSPSHHGLFKHSLWLGAESETWASRAAAGPVMGGLHPWTTELPKELRTTPWQPQARGDQVPPSATTKSESGRGWRTLLPQTG